MRNFPFSGHGKTKPNKANPSTVRLCSPQASLGRSPAQPSWFDFANHLLRRMNLVLSYFALPHLVKKWSPFLLDASRSIQVHSSRPALPVLAGRLSILSS